jgi:hypothetical protein
MNDTSPHPSSPDPTIAAASARPDGYLDQLVSWLERRLDETVGWRHASRLYGLTVLDRDALLAGAPDAARVTFLAEGWVYDLLASPSARLATEYDALGLCCFGRATNLETLERSRCRTVLVADASGQATVNRLRGKPPVLAGHPTGPVADVVEALFGTIPSAPTDRRP